MQVEFACYCQISCSPEHKEEFVSEDFNLVNDHFQSLRNRYCAVLLHSQVKDGIDWFSCLQETGEAVISVAIGKTGNRYVNNTCITLEARRVLCISG